MKRFLIFSTLASLVLLTACNKESMTDGFTPNNEELTPEATKDLAFSESESQAIASFTINNDKGKLLEQEALLLTNQSEEAVSYHWDFGNGDTSSKANPKYHYNMHGYYTVTLTITDAQGNTHQASDDVLVLCIFGGGDHDK